MSAVADNTRVFYPKPAMAVMRGICGISTKYPSRRSSPSVSTLIIFLSGVKLEATELYLEEFPPKGAEKVK
jgi:hypothetical protein